MLSIGSLLDEYINLNKRKAEELEGEINSLKSRVAEIEREVFVPKVAKVKNTSDRFSAILEVGVWVIYYDGKRLSSDKSLFTALIKAGYLDGNK